MAIKTQEYSEATSLTIHAIGAGQLDKISIGETEVGDLITIQNTTDLGGGSYIVTAIEEFHNDNPDELTETYAVYTVVADTKRCSGSIATEEKAVIRIIPQQAVPAFEDSEYLKRNQSNDVTTGFRIKSGNNTLVSTSGNKLGLYNLSTPTNASHAVNLGYLQDNYLKLGGGTMTGALACTRPKTIFKDEEGKHRVTADGAVKAGHDTSHAFMAVANDVVTRNI